MTTTERFCILLNHQIGKKKEKGIVKTGTSKVEVLPGTLLTATQVSTLRAPILETVDSSDPNVSVEVNVESSDYRDITKEEFDLLISVPTCHERLTIFCDRQWLQEGIQLKNGDNVDVYHKGLGTDVAGTVRYKGSVKGADGTHFGVELLGNPGQGISDGVFRKERYFRCPPESAIFVGLHRIRKSKGPVVTASERKQQAEGAAGPYRQYMDESVGGLRLGSRVVWISDSGPEFGVVKWIGILPDAQRDDDYTVGVEFDNPVGSGTGKYKDIRLFNAKQGHASLVPVMGLMKEDEYMGRTETKPEIIPDLDTANLAQFMDPRTSQQELIAQQQQIMEEAKHNKFSPRQSAATPGEDGAARKLVDPHISERVRSDYVLGEEAASQPPPAPHKGFSASRGINPLYEYSRARGEYLDEGLGADTLSAHGSQGNSTSRSNKQTPPPDPDLEVGSMVEVMSSQPLYGYIKWIGHLPDQKEPKKLIAGLEMEDEISAGTDGTFRQHRLFHCPPRKGFFVPLYKCKKDKRFLDGQHSLNFGSTETPDLIGTVSPPDSLEDIQVVCGKGKGIQGHHNSCYMDATLLAMFYFTTVFDSILHRPRTPHDLPEYEDVKQVLKEGIVNPLRKHHYVRADKMMKLRKLLDKVGKIPGMMSEEKDPEEFLNLLLNEITKAEPFLKISAGDNAAPQQTFFYQLIMEKDERLVLPTTQQLFELSFLQMGIKLKEVPSCLIIQMPRFGKDYKMYKRILPSLELDITDVLENAPRECIICGDLAAFECKECYQVHGAGLNTIAFCDGCKRTSHQHKQRLNHQPRQIHVPAGFREYMSRHHDSGSIPIPREKMELFAVICIQTSHYVSFVKSGKGREAKWIFFDSMADRMGEQSGYNIPEVKECSDIPLWLSDEYYNEIMKNPQDKTLPEHMRRLICDAYICLYQSPDVMMFK